MGPEATFWLSLRALSELHQKRADFQLSCGHVRAPFSSASTLWTYPAIAGSDPNPILTYQLPSLTWDLSYHCGIALWPGLCLDLATVSGSVLVALHAVGPLSTCFPMGSSPALAPP